MDSSPADISSLRFRLKWIIRFFFLSKACEAIHSFCNCFGGSLLLVQITAGDLHTWRLRNTLVWLIKQYIFNLVKLLTAIDQQIIKTHCSVVNFTNQRSTLSAHKKKYLSSIKPAFFNCLNNQTWANYGPWARYGSLGFLILMLHASQQNIP